MLKLATKEYCTGCTACASVCPKGCITMAPDENGFLYPVVNTAICVACGLCESVCPITNPLKIVENTPKACAAYSLDEAMRLQSSSGGVFTEIAKDTLHKGGAVFGAAYDEKFSVVHICVETVEGLAMLRGAKYAQSVLRSTFQEIQSKLKSGQAVLFSGTPCQVGGLKAYLRKDYENLLTVDFVCHSVPSPMAWREYVKYRAQQDCGGKLPQSINLRSKITGWSRYQYSNLFRYANGTSHAIKSGDSLYMKLFVGGYINRKSCENCQFKGYARVSDLTLGDFWGIWDIAPGMDDDKGTSVVLVQSHRGTELLAQISKQLVLKEVTLEEASLQNTAMIKSMIAHESREYALKQIQIGKISEYETLCAKPKTPSQPRLLSLTCRFLGHIKRRIFYGA